MDLFLGGLASLFVFMAVVPLGLIVLALAVVFNGRQVDDPAGQRPTAIYLGVVCFITLFTVLFAGTAAVGRVSSLIVPAEERAGEGEGAWFAYAPGDGVTFEGVDGFECRPGRLDGTDNCPGGERPDPDDISIRDTVRAGLLALPAAALFAFHWRRRRRLVADEAFPGSAAWRADRVYLYLVCLVSALVAAFASAALVYDLFRLAAPDITAEAFARRSEREVALADAITMTVLTLGALAIFCGHWSAVSGESNPLRRLWPFGRGQAEPDQGPEPEPAPT